MARHSCRIVPYHAYQYIAQFMGSFLMLYCELHIFLSTKWLRVNHLHHEHIILFRR